MKQALNKQNTGFTQICNKVLLDKCLSLKAKGLYSYLYSKPSDWDFAYNRIAEELNVGVKMVRLTLIELEEAGYLERVKHGTGKVDYYLNYDKEPSGPNGHQDDVEPSVQKGKEPKRLVAKKDTISNKDIESNKENTSTEQSSDAGGKEVKEKITMDEVREVIDAFAPVNEAYLTFYGKKTEYSAAKTLIKTFPKNQIMWMIKTAPGYNKMPYRAKGDKVYTPYQLLKNWSIMKDNLVSFKISKTSKVTEIIS